MRCLALILIAAIALSLSAPDAATAGAAVTPQPLRLLRVVTPRAADVYRLHRLGLDLLEREVGHTQVAANDDDIEALERLGFQFQLVELDLEAYYRDRLGGDIHRYHTLEQVIVELDRMHQLRPDIVGKRTSIGTTWEGRSIWAVKISDHPGRDEDEPEVLFDSLHHAREPVGLEAVLSTMWHLVDAYDVDPAIHYLVDERELWFVPVVNPDGYAFNGIGGLWRKNRRPNDDGSIGVDLNRNYGFRWGFDNLGSSPHPSSQTYRGPAPFSEPETRAMRDFILERKFVTGMTIHTFSDIHLLPYGWAEVRPEAWDDFREIGHDLARHTNYPFGQPWELLYFSNGRTQDWCYHVGGMMMIEPEIGRPEDGFWPAADRVDALIRMNLPNLLHLASIAGAHVEAIDRDVVLDSNGNGFAEPGEAARLEVVLRNKGYAEAHDLVATLTSPTPGLIVHSPPRAVGNLAPRSTLTSGALVFDITLRHDVPIGEPIHLELDIAGRNGLIGQQAMTIVPGVPALVFHDDGSEGMRHWRTNRTWDLVQESTDDWAFTDSPDRPYAPNTDNILTLERSLDLTQYRSVKLTYNERFLVEPWADVCMVQAAAKGESWSTVAELSGGSQTDFRERSVWLDEFAGKEDVRLRFRLLSNNVNQKDGWTIDDIDVVGYESDVEHAARSWEIDARVDRSSNRGTRADLRLDLSAPLPVSLGLLDTTGRLVTTVAQGEFRKGTHVLSWDGRDGEGRLVSPGVYFYQLVTPQHQETLKVVIEAE